MNCCDANGACRQGHGCAARTDDTTTPWLDDITPTGSTALDDELESDLADAALGLLMTLLLVSATAFACGFVFAKMFG